MKKLTTDGKNVEGAANLKAKKKGRLNKRFMSAVIKNNQVDGDIRESKDRMRWKDG